MPFRKLLIFCFEFSWPCVSGEKHTQTEQAGVRFEAACTCTKGLCRHAPAIGEGSVPRQVAGTCKCYG